MLEGEYPNPAEEVLTLVGSLSFALIRPVMLALLARRVVSLHQMPPTSIVLVRDQERWFRSVAGLVYAWTDCLHSLLAIQSLPLGFNSTFMQSSLETMLFQSENVNLFQTFK